VSLWSLCTGPYANLPYRNRYYTVIPTYSENRLSPMSTDHIEGEHVVTAQLDLKEVAELEAEFKKMLGGDDDRFIDLISSMNIEMMPFSISFQHQASQTLASATLVLKCVGHEAIPTSAPASPRGLAAVLVWLDTAKEPITNGDSFDGSAAWRFVESSPLPDFSKL
jgi:hypothetical protein